MGLFSKKGTCDICLKRNVSIKKHTYGFNYCDECKSKALSVLDKNEFERFNIIEISYVVRNGSLNASIKYCEDSNYSASQTLQQLKPDADLVDLFLRSGEICFYSGSARSMNSKERIEGYKNYSTGTSYKLFGGLSLRNSESMSIPIRRIHTETFAGDLYITNKRIVLLCDKYGFDLPIDKLNGIERYSNGFKLYYKDKCHVVISYDTKAIFYIINLLLQINEEDIILIASENAIPKTEEKEDDSEITYENYEDVKEFVIYKQVASTSLLQRRFSFSYEKAAKIIDMLENDRIIGPYNESKPRKVLIKK